MYDTLSLDSNNEVKKVYDITPIVVERKNETESVYKISQWLQYVIDRSLI